MGAGHPAGCRRPAAGPQQFGLQRIARLRHLWPTCASITSTLDHETVALAVGHGPASSTTGAPPKDRLEDHDRRDAVTVFLGYLERRQGAPGFYGPPRRTQGGRHTPIAKACWPPDKVQPILMERIDIAKASGPAAPRAYPPDRRHRQRPSWPRSGGQQQTKADLLTRAHRHAGPGAAGAPAGR
jgi:hypothetical protein